MNPNITLMTISMIFASVLSSSVAQVTLKTGMSSKRVLAAMESGDNLLIATTVFLNLHVILGLILYFLAAIFWLYVLAKLDVSIAYPFVGLGFIFTMILAHFIIGEPITSTKLVGTCFVAIGVVLIARQSTPAILG